MLDAVLNALLSVIVLLLHSYPVRQVTIIIPFYRWEKRAGRWQREDINPRNLALESSL